MPDDRSPRAQQLPPIDPQLLAELRQQIKDIDEGREPPGTPWEEARLTMFAPFTPEELAEIEETRRRRARR